MTELLIGGLLLFGTILMLLAGVGILRMPDLLLRMSATTKAATLGVSAILVATAWFFQSASTTSLSMAIVGFLFLTAPVAAHMIARAAYADKITLCAETHIDDLVGQYEPGTGKLASPDAYTTPTEARSGSFEV